MSKKCRLITLNEDINMLYNGNFDDLKKDPRVYKISIRKLFPDPKRPHLKIPKKRVLWERKED